VTTVDELLTDRQQADVVRKWLRENGGFMLGGLVLGLGGLFGWNQWQDYRDTQAEQASALYENFAGELRGNRMTRADELFAELGSTFGSSPYFDQARFLMAKSYLDRNEFDTAADHLAQIIADTQSAGLAHIAGLRLARVRLHQQRFDDALGILEAMDPDSAFAARYYDVRGDVYVAMNRIEDARGEYQSALAAERQPPVVDRVYVQAKLDDLGIASLDVIDEDPVQATGGDDSAGEPAPAE